MNTDFWIMTIIQKVILQQTCNYYSNLNYMTTFIFKYGTDITRFFHNIKWLWLGNIVTELNCIIVIICYLIVYLAKISFEMIVFSVCKSKKWWAVFNHEKLICVESIWKLFAKHSALQLLGALYNWMEIQSLC